MATCFVVGATGAVGKALINQLVTSDKYSKVVTFGRRELPESVTQNFTEEQKQILTQEIIPDFGALPENPEWQKKFEGISVGFCCLGTTRKQAGSAEAFRLVDYHYVVNIAETAKEKGCEHFLLVTSIGSDANSWFLYPRTKGEVENKLISLNFPKLTIFRPSVLDRGEDIRFVERLSIPLMNFSSTYKAMPLPKLARAMIEKSVNPSQEAVKILENHEIHSFVEKL